MSSFRKVRNDYLVKGNLESLSFVQTFSFFFFFFRAALVACGGSQAMGRIRAASGSLHHSHTKARSEPHLRRIPQLVAMLDP